MKVNGVTDEVVNQIVLKVLAAMRSRGLGVDAKPAQQARAQRAQASPPAQLRARADTTRTTGAPRKVFLTADMLLRRLAADSGQGRTVELASNEFLTPAAIDLAGQRNLKVHKRPKPLACPAETAQLPAAISDASACAEIAALGLVVRQPNELVRGVLEGLERDGILAIDFNQTDCWIVNTRMLCEAVVSGTLAGGVVMVPLADDAVILANKVRGIRAVQGVRTDSLAGAMARLAPNVLVLEHSSGTFHEIRTMLRLFAAGSAAEGRGDAVMAAIEKLERA